jgi:chromosome segregation ATPase
MSAKILSVLLLLVCVGLGIGLFYRHQQAIEHVGEKDKVIEEHSNRLVRVFADLEDAKMTNQMLYTNLETRTVELERLSNNLTEISANLAKTQADAQTAAEAAAAEVAKRDAKIAELEGQNDNLTTRMVDLNTTMASLETQIQLTQRKVEAAEGDREFLLEELRRLQREKAELERQFNDLAVLREQVRRLRDELSVARRLEWIRQGIYGQEKKGAEKLMEGTLMPAPVPRTNVDLNVELRQDGEVKIESSTPSPE